MQAKEKIEIDDVILMSTAVIYALLLAVPFVWGSWLYWAEMLGNIPDGESFFLKSMLLSLFGLVYLGIIGIFIIIWSQISIWLSSALGLLLGGIVWLYRKIRV